jgi:hypothetical protein
MSDPTDLYGGFSGVEMIQDSFDLGEGVLLRRTYAHLMSPCLMAFAPPGPQGHHPAPWKAAKGGYGFDIKVEVRVPHKTPLSEYFDARETIWWIAALLRLAKAPFLLVPVISDRSFASIPKDENEPTLWPFETERRIFSPGDEANRFLDTDVLEWIRDKWIDAGYLVNSNSMLRTAIKAFDSATVHGRTSASLLALWGGLEQLFAPSPGELRFRVAALLASYLEPPGTARFELYKRILKLYNDRSVAAHTAEEIETAPLVHSYVLMRNALVRMIDENKVPSQPDLEALLFQCEPYDSAPPAKRAEP